MTYEAISAVDESFANKYTAIAVTYNFKGSPHIDTQNIGPFYSIAFGDYEEGTGCICVESGPFEVTKVNTKNRFGKVDGRFPHWVDTFAGDRYSVVYYVTEGEMVERTTATFENIIDSK